MMFQNNRPAVNLRGEPSTYEFAFIVIESGIYRDVVLHEESHENHVKLRVPFIRYDRRY